MKTTIAALCLSTSALSFNASATWYQWTGPGSNGHYYQAVSAPETISWSAAEAQAESMGGTLATITSAAENNFVYSLVASDPSFWFQFGDTRGPWLGGYQPAGSAEPAGGWTWVTGEPFVFTNWAAGEPNDAAGGGTSNYLQYFGVGPNPANTWNDIWPDAGSGAPTGFIVEVVPEPATGALMGVGLLACLIRRKARR